MKDKNITVVIVNDFDYVQGGASKVALTTAELLHERGTNVILFSATHKENNYKFKQISTMQKECLKDGIKGAFRSIYNIKVKRKFNELLKTLDVNNTVIHIHGWTKSLSSIVFEVAKKRGFKVALTVHDYFTVCPNGGFYNYNKCEICKEKPLSFKCVKTNCDSRNYYFKLYRVFRQFVQNINTKRLKNIDYFISISDFSIDKIKKYIPNKKNIKKIYNPISVLKGDRIKVEKNNTYLYVGRVDKEKGVDFFCNAISSLNLNGIIVGDGNEREHLQNKYKDSKIEFVGWQKTEDVLKYMEKAKCLIFPSKWYEGAPLTILEAVSKGIPCIVSDKCAAIEFINNNNGLIYNGVNVEDLKEKIKEYEQIDIKGLSTSTYDNYWKKPYNEEKYISEILNFYNEVI